jgi:hypothetical protein
MTDLKKNLRKEFEFIDNWYNTKNEEKLNYIHENGDDFVIKNAINWYNTINSLNENLKEIVLGDKIISLDDIKNLILSKFPDENTLLDSEKSYDDNGSLTKIGLNFAKEKLNNFKDSELFYTIQTNTIIDCGYLNITRSRNVLVYYFNYIYYTLGYSYQDFNIQIDGEYKEKYIMDIFPQIYSDDLTEYTDEFIDELYNQCFKEKNASDLKYFNNSIQKIIKDFSNNPLFDDKINILKELL